MRTPQEQRELDDLLRSAETPPKPAPAARGRRAARISADAKELKTETSDPDLSKEVVAQPKPPKEPLTGRWLKGFDHRHDPPAIATKGGAAEAERVYRSADVGKAEAFRSKGHVIVAGRHVSADGLVARSGRRRILPVDTDLALAELEGKAEQLAVVAGKVLSGRNATVFEGRVLNPLLGLPKRSVADLAAQFGISSAKVHKILKRAKERAFEEFARRYQPQIAGDHCPTCGRDYAGWDFSRCGRNNGTITDRHRHIGPTWRLDWSRMRWPPTYLHPECLPYHYWAEAATMQKKYRL